MSGAQVGAWASIPVPSNWELHGFGTLSYHDAAPADVGEYRHSFVLPAGWAGRRVFLVFDGAMTDTTARLNGQLVGPTHRGGFYRFKYEVTALLRPEGANLLEVTVAETSADESVNRAERTGDYWNFGGIFRPVWLEAAPSEFIERLGVDARADGGITVAVQVNGQGDATEVVGRVRQLDGTAVGAPFAAALTPDGSVMLRGKVEAPRQWTAETPQLYRLEVELRGGGRPLHTAEERFGFRTFEVRRGDGFYLNGRRIVLQGANRHSFHPDSGRCLGEKDHREDIRLMQEANMNAVRLSHYPADERFLELCDELGLYVLDELAGWQKCYSAEAGRPLVAEMVQRDGNHPSILFWDNGNEGGWQTALDGDFAQWDIQQRPVLHPWDVHGGINTAHYRNYDATVEMAAGGFSGVRRDGRPMDEPRPLIYMPTEFLHALYDGGGGAGLEDYWEVMRRSPVAGGGFLWAWVDEGVRRPDTGRIDVQGNQAPDGILGPYREKEGSFFAVKDIWCPVVVRERELPDDFDGTLSVENRYAFTDLDQCRFAWQLRRMPAPDEPAAATLAEGIAPAPRVEPGASGRLLLGLPADWRAADVLVLRADDPHGRELWTWTWPLRGLSRFAALSAAEAGGAASVVAEETADTLRATAGDLVVDFAKSTGRLVRVRRGAQAFSLIDGPRLAVGQAALADLSWRAEGSDLVVLARYTGQLQSVEWRVRANGWVDCDFAYTATQPAPYLGVCFDYPEGLVQSKRWVGEGPYRVWQNRRRGVSLGEWSNEYNDTITGYSGWVYPEFKGCFAGVRWLRLATTEGPITVVIGTEGLDVQVLTPSFPPEAEQRAAVTRLPQAGLAFLHVIPAVGEKFTPAEAHGPQSQLVPVREGYRGRVSFRFGR